MAHNFGYRIKINFMNNITDWKKKVDDHLEKLSYLAGKRETNIKILTDRIKKLQERKHLSDLKKINDQK